MIKNSLGALVIKISLIYVIFNIKQDPNTLASVQISLNNTGAVVDTTTVESDGY